MIAMCVALLIFILGSPMFADQAYEAQILKQRLERDETFRSKTWSPLAVISIAPLDRPKTVVGSSPECDFHLEGEGVAARHAEILREFDSLGQPMYSVHALEGKLWTDTDPSREFIELPLLKEFRMRVGPFVVYADNLGTFGMVVRALDFTTPAFTRFTGLSYFPPDIAYRVDAAVTPFPKIEPVTIADTHGWQRPAWRYGEAAFSLHGKELRLVLLLWTEKPGPGSSFFVAFTDETRGRETYPAVRYLEVPFVSSGAIVLDFNRAINPLCAYNLGFACPLPLKENRLAVEIRAGEKIYPHAAGH